MKNQEPMTIETDNVTAEDSPTVDTKQGIDERV